MAALGFVHDSGRAPVTILRFRTASLALALVAFIKYAGLAVMDFANSPHFFLLFLVLPFVVAGLLARRAPRTGAIVFLLFGVLYAWLMVQQLVGGIEDYWGDYLLVFVGLPICLVGLALAVLVLKKRGSD